MKLMLCKARIKSVTNRVRGVTLLELLVALAIGSILIGVGVPAYESIVRNNRLATDTNQLVAAIHYARSEAIKMGQSVRICISEDADFGTDTCTTSGTDWSNGWNIRITGTVPAGVPETLRYQAPLSGDTTLIEQGPNTNTGFIEFDRLGFTGDGRTIVACEPTDTQTLARGLIVTPVGQVMKAGDSNADNIVENAAGVNVTCS